MSLSALPSNFEGPRAKLEQAKEHIEKLNLAIHNFLNDNPYSIFKDEQSSEGEQLFRVCVHQSVPLSFRASIGDIVHNLRSALDLMTADLAKANGHSSRTAIRETFFPIFSSREEFEVNGRGKIKRLSARAKEVIEELEPYKGGQTAALYQLHHLNIADKHNTLLPVGAAYVDRGVSFRIGSAEAPLSTTYPDGISGTLGGTFQLPEAVFPLEDNVIVAVVFSIIDERSFAEVDASYKLVFGKHGIADGQPIIDTLVNFYRLVEWVIYKVEAECLK